MAVPPLTPEQRAEALAKAAAARRERAAIRLRLKTSGGSIREVIEDRRGNEAVAKMRVLALVESMPGIGRVKAERIMDELGIARSRRVRGLGQHQVAALVARFEGS
ncbi:MULTISPECIES: integration host factor, actinobacterial type [Janibacter]|uniref:30S ribosomal protein S13 n=1 Tax=Janibacter melonis TaxID=262209 RepID=A0A5P8FKJ4_9MICO|nr:integration host factor, actinobacterial type [Janibacter melonis]MCB5990016.1 30S ribosomal protein S13 [Janibacter melonis]MCM3556099.1 30S ribosomal protein S13 [Janibacter melonis]QFQ30046.1 30S ribosomal protein S13 [Janibacter melonis]